MRALHAVLAGALCAATLACGKKGPPLPPLEGSIPRIVDLELEQVGDEARALFSLPIRPEAEGIDYVTTAIELWRRAAEPGASAGADLQEKGGVGAFTKDATLVDEAKGPGLFEILALPRPHLSDPEPGADGEPVHEYALVLRTDQRKRGTLSNVVTMEVLDAPGPPTDFRAEPTETGVLLSWTAPSPPPAPPERADEEQEAGEDERSAAAPAPQAVSFNVYRAIEDRNFAPDPLNANPLREPEWADADVAEGVRYRYRVRSLIAVGDRQVLSRASETLGVDYRDAFPPAVPSGLRLIPDGSRTVNVLWNPNNERDLAGYAISRREPGGEWRRLDSGDLRSASWVDQAVTPGRTYEYAVAAYDGASPPNTSEPTEPRRVTLPAASAAP